jgi:hypothetical protein
VQQYQAQKQSHAGWAKVADAVIEAELFKATLADVVQREDSRVSSSAFHMRDISFRQQFKR